MGNANKFDIIFLGAGLSSCLAAIRLMQANMKLRILILESQTLLHGNKTWSFHENDFEERNEYLWMRTFVDCEWPGYQVKFKSYERKFDSKYFSIKSDTLRVKLKNAFGPNLKENAEVLSVTGSVVQLRNGDKYSGNLILDGRGFSKQIPKECGFQKFIGLQVEMEEAHGLNVPIVMDATVPQSDGYRFFYCLPFSKTEMLIEDTYYSNALEISREDCITDIHAYAKTHGWKIKSVIAEETGCLPIPYFSKLNQNGIAIGTAGGLFHSTTGYSIANAIKFSNWLLEKLKAGDLSSDSIHSYLEESWNEQSFLRRLNRMMFLAADPAQRFRIFERFYTFDDQMIARFYSGKLFLRDKLRLVIGKPPVPVTKGIRHFFASHGEACSL